VVCAHAKTCKAATVQCHTGKCPRVKKLHGGRARKRVCGATGLQSGERTQRRKHVRRHMDRPRGAACAAVNRPGNSCAGTASGTPQAGVTGAGRQEQVQADECEGAKRCGRADEGVGRARACQQVGLGGDGEHRTTGQSRRPDAGVGGYRRGRAGA
jgi:hypothetical protein